MPFGAEIWVCDGPVVPFIAGFPYPTRMAVIRLSDGRLFIWSPVALDEDLRAEVDALGTVRYLVSPNKIHHLFLGHWKAAWPEAQLYASPGLRPRRRDLAFDADLDAGPKADWADEIDQITLRGSLAMTEVVFFHHRSRTAIFADLIENFPRDWFHGWRGVLAHLDGIVEPNAGAPREWRWSFLNRAHARADLRRILDWPIERVLMAHGTPVTEDGAAFVHRSFRWLIGHPGAGTEHLRRKP